MKTKVLIMAAMIGMASAAKAQQTKDIKLPQPEMSLEATLMDAFKERKSTREFSEKELSLQELSGQLSPALNPSRHLPPAKYEKSTSSAFSSAFSALTVLTFSSDYTQYLADFV